MQALAISETQLADAIHIPYSQLNEFLTAQKPLIAELVLRFARYFNTDAQLGLNLQNNYDLEIIQDMLGDKLEKTIKPLTRTLEKYC